MTEVRPRAIVVMGVAGSGKSTVAALLAMMLRYEFKEGDLLHPPENVEKMRNGAPLTDADRAIWLDRVAAAIDDWRARGKGGVISCSALKRSYRHIIIGDRLDVALVYLKGSYDLIHSRMAARHEHFMPVALLDSQFAILEEPAPDEHPIVVDIDATPAAIAAEIVRRLDEVVIPAQRSASLDRKKICFSTCYDPGKASPFLDDADVPVGNRPETFG